MKKLTNKLRRKKQVEPEKPVRITNETVAEQREQILAGGRKFKYPVQYSKHKLLVNSVIIALIAFIALFMLSWFLLYVVQVNSKFMYRLTQLVPLPVAQVDGEPVRYSEYLKKYRGDVTLLIQQEQINLKSEDGKRQSEYYKRKELDTAVRDAYVNKLAREKGIKVSQTEVNDYITNSINTKSITLSAFEKTVLRNYYDWSLDDYRGVVKSELLARKVDFAIDDKAKARANELAKRAQTEDFAELAKAESDDLATKPNGGDVGVLPSGNLDVNGLIVTAKRLNEGQVSSAVQGTDGYYIVKLIKKSDVNIHYAMIKVNLNELEKRFQAVKKAGKVVEYIKVEKSVEPTSR